MVVKKAIFFDRDGVLNSNIYYKKFKNFEAPIKAKDLKIHKNLFKFLKILKKDYVFFIITNQPSYAKGKVLKRDLNNIQKKFKKYFLKKGIKFKKYLVCYNTEDISKNFCKNLNYCEYKNCHSVKKICKKPSANLLNYALKKYSIDKKNSWFLGDRQKDLDCAKKSNIKSILISSNPQKNFKYYTLQFKKVENALKYLINEN